jgi:hypothetical protein
MNAAAYKVSDEGEAPITLKLAVFAKLHIRSAMAHCRHNGLTFVALCALTKGVDWQLR